MNLSKYLNVIAILLTLLVFAPSVDSKPMMPPSLDEAITCNWIVIASYQNHDDLSKVSYAKNPEEFYMRGLTATYKIEKILKDNPGSQTDPLPHSNNLIHVAYSFHDFSPCMPDKSFRFSEDRMPKRGSQWILFLQRQDDLQHQSPAGWFGTYRGDKGRLEANAENIQKVTNLIQASADDPHHYRRASILYLTFFSDTDFAQLANCDKLETLYATCGPAVTGKGFKYIRDLSSLHTLVLGGEHIKDESLVGIAGQSTITSFSLTSPLVTDAGLEHLKGLKKLNKLLLITPLVSGAGLNIFQESPQLTDLVLNNCSHFTDTTLKGIAGLTSLRDLQMDNCTNITDTGLEHLVLMKNLVNLTMNDVPGIKGSGLKYLAQLPQLKKLTITSSSIDDANLPALDGTNIELLNLTFSKVTDKGIPALRCLHNLNDLTISDPGNPITDISMQYLSEMPKLSGLNLNFSNITDKGVAELTKLSNLEHLSLAQTKITGKSIDYLEHMPKLKDVELTSTAITTAEANHLTYLLHSRR